MKLPLLLTRFLYEHKKLNLPGIGSFTLDPSVVIPENPEKNTHETIEGIEFRHLPVYKADDELIDFIKLHTGKIKPLAEADLESYLTLGIQLLNIGKPFYFDGIGAIVKSQEGGYEFTPGEYSIIKPDEQDFEKEKADRKKAVFEEKHGDQQPESNGLGKFMLVIGIIGGLVLIGWGGYHLYKTNTYSENPGTNSGISQEPEKAKNDTVVANTQPASQPDTAGIKSTANTQLTKPAGDSVAYKFVILATGKKYRALKRYEQLLSYSLNVKMETIDSTYFKLYFNIPAFPKDTVYIKDSLNRVYATKVFIER